MTAEVLRKSLSQPSPRQIQVLQAVAAGLTDRQIGRVLNMSERTVVTHLREFRWAVGARNRAHLVAIGFEQGWLGGAR